MLTNKLINDDFDLLYSLLNARRIMRIEIYGTQITVEAL